MSNSSKIIVALDCETDDELSCLIQALDPKACRLKIGKTLFTQKGPEFVKQCQSMGFDVFLDLKFHDIPQQVAGACLAAAKMGVWMVNVHASGGLAMLKAAREAVDKQPGRKPLLIGVTVLTSLNKEDLDAIGMPASPSEQVLRLAKLCFDAKLDGVVCSAEEAPLIKAKVDKDFLCVTPGIRLAHENKHDQKRVVTPTDAISGGSDYLVMGRSITHSSSPKQTLHEINESICTL